jgi:hypothetical protein
MFIKRVAPCGSGIYIAGMFKTMIPRNDVDAIYDIPDADAEVVLQLGLYQEVRPDQVTEFLGLGKDSHSGDLTWIRQTK